ncbi:MAG: glutamine amidotransferase [Ruminococcaceae bacterium]|nr:glutamine amidotransferase [Oscillospiraceae bacterium]
MKLKILSMYPDLLNMYGDIGNVKILKRRAEKRGIETELCTLSAGQPFPADADIIMLGAGQDFEMHIVLEDMRGEKKEALRAYIEDGGVFLAVGTGFQLLGTAFVSGEGETREGLGILPVVTEPSDVRFVGNIAAEIDGVRAVGFENHAGCTRIGNLKPLGHVLSGHGNNGEDGNEGARYKNTVCTFFHGPFLSKNPEQADKLLLSALQRKYKIDALESLDDTYEYRAKETILSKLGL